MTAPSTPEPPQRDGDEDAGGASGGSEEKSESMHDADVANGENPAE